MQSAEHAIPLYGESLPRFACIGSCNLSIEHPGFFPRSPKDETSVTLESKTPIETIDPKLLCLWDELFLPVSTANRSPSPESYIIASAMGNATSSPTSGIPPDTPGRSDDSSGYSSMTPDTPSDSDAPRTPGGSEEYAGEANGGRPVSRPEPLATMYNVSNIANHPNRTTRTSAQDPFIPRPVFHAHAGPPLYIRIDGGYMIIVPSGRTWFIPESALSTNSVQLNHVPYPSQFLPSTDPVSPNSSFSHQAQASANNNTVAQGASSPGDVYPTPESLSPRPMSGPRQYYFVEPETIQTIGKLYERE